MFKLFSRRFIVVRLLRLSWNLFKDPRVPAHLKTIPVLAAAYVVSPIDLMPDLFLGLGQVDDLVVSGLMLLAFASMAPREVVDEYFPGFQGFRRQDPQDRENRSQRSRSQTTIDGNFRYMDEG